MSKSSNSSQLSSVESVLEEHIPREHLAEVKRILYGNPVESVPIPESANALASQHEFEIKAYKSPCATEQMRSPRLVRIALIQNSIVKPTTAPVREQFEAIRDKIEHMIDAAAAAGANVVCFQEAWTMPFAFCTREKQPWLEFAEDASSGPSAEFCRRKAKQHRMVIVSPILERDEAHGDTIWNTAVVFGPAGNYIGKSRKNHIPRVGDFNESTYYMEGNTGHVVFDTQFGRIATNICVPEEHEILTDRGFFDLSAYKAAVAQDPTIKVAGYDHKTQHMLFETPNALVENPAEARRLVEFTCSTDAQHKWREGAGEYGAVVDQGTQHDVSTGVSLVVTREHQVFAQWGNCVVRTDGRIMPHYRREYVRKQIVGDEEDGKVRKVYKEVDYEKIAASTFVDSNDSTYNCVRQMAAAANGVRGDDADAAFLPVRNALGLDSDAKADAFLELYGFWLGDGFLHMVDGGERGKRLAAVSFAQIKRHDLEWIHNTLGVLGIVPGVSKSGKTTILSVSDRRWTSFFGDEYGHKYGKQSLDAFVAEFGEFDVTSSAAGSFMEPELNGNGNILKSSKWFASWVWRLNATMLRLVLRGLQRADGTWAAKEDRRIFTSSVRFRDEIVRLLLMAGYSCRFGAMFVAGAVRSRGMSATAANWWVAFAERRASSEPVLTKVRGEIQEIDYNGAVWCFNMPSGFIWVRRVYKNAAGVVTKASKPILTGNCFGRHHPLNWMMYGLNGAEIVFNPSATVGALSEPMWGVEARNAAIANSYFVGAINRVGTETFPNEFTSANGQPAHKDFGHFYGSSYVAAPDASRTPGLSRTSDGVLITEIDLNLCRQVKDRWGFRMTARYPLYADSLTAYVQPDFEPQVVRDTGSDATEPRTPLPKVSHTLRDKAARAGDDVQFG